jgi:uncharacterized protein
MTKALTSAIFAAVLTTAPFANAQSWGGGSPYAPGANSWGSGVNMVEQPCGAQPWQGMEEPEEPEEIADQRERVREIREKEFNVRKEKREIDRALRDKRRSLSRYVTDVEAFEATVMKCNTAFNAVTPNQRQFTNDPAKRDALLQENYKLVQPTFGGGTTTQSGASDGAMQCSRLFMDTEIGMPFRSERICSVSVRDANQPRLANNIKGPNFDENFKNCYREAAGLHELLEKEAKAKAEYERIQADAKNENKILREVRTEVARDRREMERLGIDDYADAEYAGCRGCEARARARAPKRSKSEIWGQVAVSILGIGANTALEVNRLRGNRRLGYPSGPSPFLVAGGIGGAGAGYPYIFGGGGGGIYGSIYGGVGQGGYGCSPSIGGNWGGASGPWAQAGIYGGAAYPYGGGIYNPGVGPWGYPGPWGNSGPPPPYYNAGAGAYGQIGFPPGQFPNQFPGQAGSCMPTPSGCFPMGNINAGGIPSPYGVNYQQQQLQAQLAAVEDYSRRYSLYIQNINDAYQKIELANSILGAGGGYGSFGSAGYGNFGAGAGGSFGAYGNFGASFGSAGYGNFGAGIGGSIFGNFGGAAGYGGGPVGAQWGGGPAPFPIR